MRWIAWWSVIMGVSAFGTVVASAQQLPADPADPAGAPWGVIITVTLLLGGGLVALVMRGRPHQGAAPPAPPPPQPAQRRETGAPARGGGGLPEPDEAVPPLPRPTPPVVVDAGELPARDDDLAPPSPALLPSVEQESAVYADTDEDFYTDADADTPAPEPIVGGDIVSAGDVSGGSANMGGAAIPPAPDLKTAQFTAYYPREAAVEKKHGLYVYASVPDDDDIAAAVQADVGRYREELGGEVPAPKAAKQTADLAHGTPITVTPESDTLEFEPPTLTKRWRGTWTQFGFDFYPAAALANELCVVRVSVAVAGVEIAHINAPIEVVPAAPAPPAPAPSLTLPSQPDGGLLQQALTAQHSAPYRRIFPSYAAQDGEVLNAVRLAKLALGADVFVDVEGLRQRDDWQAALAAAIDEADAFQLYWSENAAASPYCAYELAYTLDKRCDDAACAGFIRPVYWDTPMPDVPAPLERLKAQFRYVELIAAAQTTYNVGDVQGGVVTIGGSTTLGDDAQVLFNAAPPAADDAPDA